MRQNRWNLLAAVAFATLFFCGALLLMSGCAELDKVFIPDPVTGVSQADQAGQHIKDAANTFGFSPWGEIAAGALSVFGAGYILIRRIRKATAVKKSK